MSKKGDYGIGDVVKAEGENGYVWGEITAVEIDVLYEVSYGINGTCRRYKQDAVTLICPKDERYN